MVAPFLFIAFDLSYRAVRLFLAAAEHVALVRDQLLPGGGVNPPELEARAVVAVVSPVGAVNRQRRLFGAAFDFGLSL